MKSSGNHSAVSMKRKSGAKGFRRSPFAGEPTPTKGNGKLPELVAAVDIGGSNLRVALADLSGNIVGRWNASTKATSSPEMVIAQIERGIERLFRQASSSPGSLLSMAVGVAGATDSKKGHVLATSYLKGWKDVPLRQMLESRLRVPAAIENDVRMAALGEHWRGVARGVKDFVFLAIGTGIGAGVLANGKLIHGAYGTAGEVGYMLVPNANENPARPGEPGALESLLGGDGIQRRWLSVSSDGASARNLTATEIFARADAGDPLAKRLLDQSAKLLAHTVYNISLVLNSAVFVLGGGIGVSASLRDASNRILAKYNTPSRPKLVISSLGTDAQLTGAIWLALTMAKRSARIRT
jgi:glucokinase